MAKVFYEYHRKKNGNLKGVVMAIDKGVYGWSMCDSKDRFTKEVGVTLAARRALKALSLDVEDREAFYGKVPQTLQPLFDKIKERAQRYYKETYVNSDNNVD